MADTTVTPFTVSELIATSLDALVSAASLHLGEALPDGRRLDQPDPMEAWRALLAIHALLGQLGPMMDDGAIAPFKNAYAYLIKRLAERHPGEEFPVPGPLLAMVRAADGQAAGPRALPDLKAMTEAALAEQRPTGTAPLTPRPAARPGVGLPTKGSGPLFGK
jgi:hypothetical protein